MSRSVVIQASWFFAGIWLRLTLPNGLHLHAHKVVIQTFYDFQLSAATFCSMPLNAMQRKFSATLLQTWLNFIHSYECAVGRRNHAFYWRCIVFLVSVSVPQKVKATSSRNDGVPHKFPKEDRKKSLEWVYCSMATRHRHCMNEFSVRSTWIFNSANRNGVLFIECA